MKSERFSEKQIIGILEQAQAGMKIVDLCRQQGIRYPTIKGERRDFWIFLGLERRCVKLFILEMKPTRMRHPSPGG